MEMTGTRVQPVIVSRSDSTLRGHYPVETDVMAEELGPFDAHFLVPAFFEGGRITRDGMHYLLVDGRPVPVHETEFARDSVFGFSTGFLPDYVEEKTAGRIPPTRSSASAWLRCEATSARAFVPAGQYLLRGRRRAAVRPGWFCAPGAGRRSRWQAFLFRSAASLLTAFACLADAAGGCRGDVAPGPRWQAGRGVGRFACEKSTRQLRQLIETTDVLPVHIDLDWMVRDERAVAELAQQMVEAERGGRNIVLYTSRGERGFDSKGGAPGVR